eukprot:SAG22_NODE_26_length_29806_cov_19.885381_6_plen_103_part_00
MRASLSEEMLVASVQFLEKHLAAASLRVLHNLDLLTHSSAETRAVARFVTVSAPASLLAADYRAGPAGPTLKTGLMPGERKEAPPVEGKQGGGRVIHSLLLQ